MIGQSAIFKIWAISIIIFGLVAISGLETTEAFEWKWTKYEKWNCCPGFNPNSNIKPIPIPGSISSN